MLLFYYLIVALLCAEVLSKQPWEKDNKKGKNYKTRSDKLAVPVRNRSLEEINEEKKKSYWNKQAIDVIQTKLRKKLNENTAKNIIFFLGDGMSIPTVTATRVFIGGEEQQLSFEKFPFTALSKTYCVDHQTADSACSATAYLGGVKANLATIGVTAAVNKKNCTAMNNSENHVHSIAKLFQLKGKRTGLVTTMRVTHASPAGLYAHTAYRHWETDTDILDSQLNPKDCHDIASQLVFGDTGKKFQVILGGGRRNFLPKFEVDEDFEPGDRSDNKNLINEWIEDKDRLGLKYEYVWNREQLLHVDNDTEYLLGLFSNNHMNYNVDRDNLTEPSLQEMTETAIKTLQNGPEGFFLFVEGGKIDKAHHASSAYKAFDETVEFSKAVQSAIDLTNEEDTLIVVTADHAHTMSFAGHAERGSSVFGYGGIADDNKYYTTLTYANGPGYKPVTKKQNRYVPSIEEMNDIDFQWPSVAPMHSETHGADDVAIYAKGPWSHLFSGVLEENVIPHIMGFAACVSKEIQCDNNLKEP